MYIFLSGNISDGFIAYGPYLTLDEACDRHDGVEGWVMKLHK
jgi:hypothetical protein